MEHRLGLRPDAGRDEWEEEELPQRRVAPGKSNSAHARYALVTPVAQLQRRARPAPMVGADQVRETAARGVAGSGAALPFLDVIQHCFGGHDIGGISAHVGGAAAAASAAIGAEAFATGSQVAFAEAPDLHTAAHEAAHVVQQRAGVQLKGGVGEAGDGYEQQADRVADAVVAGRSAEALLGPHAGVGSTAGAAIQRKGKAHELLGKARASAKKPAKFREGSFQLLGLSFTYGIKAEVALKTERAHGELDANTSATISEAKLELLTRKIALAFAKGKTRVAGYEQLYLAVDGKLAEASMSDGRPNLKVATARLTIKGEAPALLASADSKVTVAVSGYVSVAALDATGALKRLKNLDRRVRECGARVDDRGKEIKRLEKRHRFLKAKEQRIHNRHSRAVARKRGSKQASRRARYDQTRHRLNKQFKRAHREANEMRARIASLDQAYARDLKALRRAEKAFGRGVRSLHDKASRAFARGLAAFSKRFIGKVLLRALPIVGWIATILDIPESARVLMQLLKMNVGLGGDGGNDKQGSGGGDGGDGSGDKSGEVGTGDGDGVTAAQRVDPHATDAPKSFDEERATIDPDQPGGGKSMARRGGKKGKPVADGEVAVRPGRKPAGEDDVVAKQGEESPADGEVARRGDEEEEAGEGEDKNERVAKPGEAIAANDAEAAGPGDEAAREGDEDGRVAKPGEAIARNDGEAAAEGEEVVKEGEEPAEATPAPDGDQQGAWDSAIDAPKDDNLVVSPAVIGAEDQKSGNGRERSRRRPRGGKRSGKQRRGAVSGERKRKDKSKTVFQVYQNEVDTIARIKGGRLVAADPATLTSWARAKQIEPGALPDDATVRIRKVFVVQIGAAGSAGIPCRVSLVFDVQGLETGPELRTESFNILYSPGEHKTLEKVTGPEEKLREALASGQKRIVMPDYELEIVTTRAEEGWVEVRVTTARPGFLLTDYNGHNAEAIKDALIKLPYPQE